MRKMRINLVIVPLITVLISVIFMRIYLTYSSNQLKEEFIAQNFAELQRSDIAAISLRLNGIFEVSPITCAKAERLGLVFFRRAKGECHEQLFLRSVTVDMERHGGVKVTFLVGLHYVVYVFVAIFILCELGLLWIYAWATTHVERERQAAIRAKELQKHEIELEKSAAIARLTQMLAHDVRKPFSMVEVVMKMLRQAGNIAEVREILDSAVPEVEQAYAQTNGLINDVMEIGRVQKPVLAETTVESIIVPVLQEAFRIHADAKVKLEYRFGHAHVLSVEAGKIRRVYANIIGNAVEAMKKYGGDTLWFSSEEILVEGFPFAKLSIGNNGPGIPKEHLDQLFESFFSKKEGGTGLGLAIAKKVVGDHGGSIWCESTAEENRVEFFFTLPLGATKSTGNAELLSSSQEVVASQKNMSVNARPRADSMVKDPLEEAIEGELRTLTSRMGRKIQLALVDDDELYRRAVKNLIAESEVLSSCVETHQFSDGPGILDAKETFDAYILDVDMGEGLPNGYVVTKSLRARGLTAGICIHSNRTLPEDMQTAFLVGADQCFPKPMGRAHLLRFLRTFVIGKLEKEQEKKIVPAKTELPSERRFAVLDDSMVFRAMWNEALKRDATVHLFVTPEEFLAKAAGEPGFVDSLTAVITDNHFQPKSETTGIEFAIDLRKSSTIPIFLCSNADHELEGAAAQAITRQIGKSAVSVATVETWLLDL